MKKIKKLINKYKNIIMYLFFGVCTTLVNIISYYVFAHIFKSSVMFSTIIAWILAVLFAYVTNRKWVFESKAKNKKEIFNEMVSFFSCRLATGIVDWLGMYIFVEKIGFNDVVVKIIVNIIVIILNYIFSKLIVFSEKKKIKIEKKDLIVYGSFLVIVFIFLLNSPLHIWINTESGTDSSVFRTIGMMMKNGYLPYIQSFDHKGPIIYLYNLIGEWINHSNGIWYIEFVSLYISICYFFKISRLKCNRIISYIISLLGLTLLLNFFERGNLVEEYALPFISMSIYIFLDYVINKVINKKRLIFCGVSLGAVLMLRPNMISVWIVFCIFILIDSIRRKKYKELGNFIINFIIGLAIIVVPIFIWLGVNGLIGEFFDKYIIFNLQYSANYSVIASQLPKYVSVFENVTSYLNNFIIISSLLVIMYSIKFNKKNYVYLIYFLLTIFLACMSGRAYNHYLMIIVPAIIYPFSCFFEYCSKSDKKNNYSIISFVVCIYLIAQIIAPTWLNIIKNMPRTYHLRNENNYSDRTNNLVNIIVKETNCNDKITVYGNMDVLYLLSNRLHATNYSYQFPISKVRENILDEYYGELSKELPKIVVIESGHYDDLMKSFLNDNKYVMIYNSDNELEKSDLVFELKDK